MASSVRDNLQIIQNAVNKHLDDQPVTKTRVQKAINEIDDWFVFVDGQRRKMLNHVNDRTPTRRDAYILAALPGRVGLNCLDPELVCEMRQVVRFADQLMAVADEVVEKPKG